MLTLLVLRQQFVNILGDNINSLNGLLTDLISMFAIAELGIGDVICFSLYKPIADDNKSEVIGLMQLYKRIYFKISFVVLGIGVVFSPFLRLFTKEIYQNDLIYLYLVYFVFVLDAFFSYFFSYNKTFLLAVQKNAIVNFIRVVFQILSTLSLILVLHINKDYLSFLVIWVILRVAENATTYFFVQKKYPYLSEKKHHELTKEKKQDINKNIKALVMHKVGGTFVLKSDALVIMPMFPSNIFGFFSNYTVITNSVQKMLVQIFNGIRASFGDFAVQKEILEIKNMFNVLQLLAFIIYTWCSVFLINLCEPFISLWMGKERLIAFSALVALVLNFYLRGFRSPVELLKDVKGLYWQDRYKSIIEGAVKVGFSILLGKFFGLTGVIFGTTVSFVLVLLTVEPYIVYKYVFKQKVWPYYISHIKYFLIAIFICGITFFINNKFEAPNLIHLMIFRFFCSLIVPFFCFLLFFFKKQ
jgi:O-antigen/teichoic acid export membrane protein